MLILGGTDMLLTEHECCPLMGCFALKRASRGFVCWASEVRLEVALKLYSSRRMRGRRYNQPALADFDIAATGCNNNGTLWKDSSRVNTGGFICKIFSKQLSLFWLISFRRGKNLRATAVLCILQTSIRHADRFYVHLLLDVERLRRCKRRAAMCQQGGVAWLHVS
jgi:hypothetical protein